MSIRRSLFAVAVLGAAGVAPSITPALAQAPLRLGHVLAESHSWHVNAAGFAQEGYYPEMLPQQAAVGAAMADAMKDTPMYKSYVAVAPHPEDFPRLLEKIGAAMAVPFDLTEEIRGLQVPTLVMCADADMAPPSHYVEIFGLLDGGKRDGGWMGEGRPAGGHALAVIPGTTHYDVFQSPLFAACSLAFLDK